MSTQKKSKIVDRHKWFLHLAKAGIPLIPVLDKVAQVPWKTGASCDPEVVQGWCDKYGRTVDFAMPTGEASGFWALDIDVKKGKDGAAFFQEKFKEVEGAVGQNTPSGGFHKIFKYDPEHPIGCTTDMFQPNSGVDIRGNGGYIVLAFSTGYTLQGGVKSFPHKVTEAPEWLSKMIASETEKKTQVVKVNALHEPDYVEERLFLLDPTDPEFETRDGWQSIMRAVHSASGGADWGKDMFIRWSLQHPGPWEKSVEFEVERDWYSYSPDGGTSFGTIMYHLTKRNLVPMAMAPVEDTIEIPQSETPKIIVSKSGKVATNPHNAMEILAAPKLRSTTNAEDGEPTTQLIDNPFYNLFVYNELRREAAWFKTPVFDKSRKTGDTVNDGDISLLRSMVFKQYKGHADFPVQNMREGVHCHALKHRCHPIREFLKTLKWDGKERLTHWLTDVLGADKNAYTLAISRKVIIGAIKRVMQPGCTLQNMLVIEGEQGSRKSSVVEAMGFKDVPGRGWYSNPNLNIKGIDSGDTSAVTDTFGSWVIEMAEMAAIKNADEQMIKTFLTTSTDKVTLKYDKYATEHPRQYVLVGTMNTIGEGRYVHDQTGARRYWPIITPKTEEEPIDTDYLRSIMDQLYAEAFVAYQAGEKVYIDPAHEQEALRIAKREQEKRTVANGRLDDVADYFEMGEGIKLDKVHTSAVVKSIWHQEKRSTQFMRDCVAKYLISKGWEYRRAVRVNGRTSSGYIRL